MKRKQNKIFQIAKQTRLWAEATAKRYKFPADLCGMCCIASRYLFRALKRAGYRPKIALRLSSWDSHAFIICKNLIIDITASQFRDGRGHKPRVYITKKRSGLQWKENNLFSSERSFVKFLRKVNFIETQITLRSRIKAYALLPDFSC